MHIGFPALFLTLAVGQPSRDCYQTTNFVVFADTQEIARRVGDAAEDHRRHVGKLWLGATMPAWPARCRIDVAISDRLGGVTDVSYCEGKVLFQKVSVHGPLDRVLAGPLPHELAHVFFANHFGFETPRWADEGGAILSEEEGIRAAHRRSIDRIVAKQGQFRLRELFGMQQYPADLPCLYAQAHSVSGFLVAAKGHQVFLAFVRDGSKRTWDEALKVRYGYESVEHLERAWLDSIGNASAKKSGD